MGYPFHYHYFILQTESPPTMFKTKAFNLETSTAIAKTHSKLLQTSSMQPMTVTKGNITSKNLKSRTCPYCKKVFARPYTLKSHIRRHTNEKPFTCKVCQRSFSQSATLENHKLTHTGAKPHQCRSCFKRFAHQTSLKTHLRIHSGEQPYKCEYCERRFTDGSTLQKHRRTHNGERPFLCHYCKKPFSQSGNMRRHMATTHKTVTQASLAEPGSYNDNSIFRNSEPSDTRELQNIF